MGPLAAADFLKKLAEETPATRDQEHVPFVACGVPQIPDRTDAILRGGPSPLPAMLHGVAMLRRSGAGCIAIPCNTAHYWYDELVRGGGLPILHIADAACDEMAARGITAGAVGLLATAGTVAAGFYQQRFLSRGLACVLSHPEDQAALASPAIACVKANDLPRAHALAVRAVERLLDAGAQAVVLACTETPVAIDFAPSAVTDRCVDATRALAKACVAWHRLASGDSD